MGRTVREFRTFLSGTAAAADGGTLDRAGGGVAGGNSGFFRREVHVWGRGFRLWTYRVGGPGGDGVGKRKLESSTTRCVYQYRIDVFARFSTFSSKL